MEMIPTQKAHTYMMYIVHILHTPSSACYPTSFIKLVVNVNKCKSTVEFPFYLIFVKFRYFSIYILENRIRAL